MLLKEKAKKSLGQNFLIDKNIVEKITEIMQVNEKTTVLEIGPGYGSLTESILSKNPKKLFAIEKDERLIKLLKEKFKNFNNIKFINQDILELISNNNFGQNIIVFGNLPYNISTKILGSLITLKKWPPWYKNLVLMFQKEVADRIIAETKTKNFSRLTVLSNWRLNVKKHFDISNNCFFPKPKVASTVLSFEVKKNNYFNLKNPNNLEKITRILFSNRRKMINKNFKILFKKDKIVASNLNINLQKRPEELSNEVYYKIAQEYEKLLD